MRCKMKSNEIFWINMRVENTIGLTIALINIKLTHGLEYLP